MSCALDGIRISENKTHQTNCAAAAAADINPAQTELKVSSGLARCGSLSYLQHVLYCIMVGVQLGLVLSTFCFQL